MDRPPSAANSVKALFIINERSGKRRKVDVAELIRATPPFIASEIVPCGRIEDLDAIIDRAENENVDVVFAVGGDGTVHETARRLVHRKPALGVLPTGSGNGFARHVGIPIDPAAALTSNGGGRIVSIDTASVNGRHFLGVMGVGFDALIADRFASSNVRGLETYVREGLRAFGEFQGEEYEITANGQTIRHHAAVVAIANSGQYGNNARIAPLASLQDGLLDVVIIHETRLIDAAFLLARLFRGTLHEASGVTTFQTSALTLRRAAAGPAHLDGEPLTLPETLEVRVVPQSLRLLVPADTGTL
jgi:diacylglycerol kinase (ATP)